MKRLVLETLAVLAVGAGVGLAVNALSPESVAVTQALPVKDLDDRYITAEETWERFEKGMTIFVDARKPDEFARGHVAGALNLPAEEFAARYVEMAAVLPREADIVTYCGGEDCALSRQLADRLGEVGYAREKVRIFRGGWKVWKERAWPVE